MDKITLEVWPAEFLLPSFDAQCLQYMACVKFSGAPIKVEAASSPWLTPNGNYPAVKGSTYKNCSGFREFVSFAKRLSQNEDFDDATEEYLADMESLKSLTVMHIRPAYLYMLWLNEYNYPAIVEPWTCETLGLIYSYYYSRKMQRRAESSLRQCFGCWNDVRDIEQSIISSAKSGLKILSDNLANKRYFFGDKPTSLDAFVFGYLAPMFYIPLPDDRIQQFMRTYCTNLFQFVVNILNNYLPLSEEEQEMHRTRMRLWDDYRIQYQSRRTAHLHAQPNKYPLWEKVVFGASAAVLTVAFAIACGVFQIRIMHISTNKNGYE